MSHENLDRMINFSRNSIKNSINSLSSLESLSRNSLESLELLATEIRQHYVPRTELHDLEIKIKQMETELQLTKLSIDSKSMSVQTDCNSTSIVKMENEI